MTTPESSRSWEPRLPTLIAAIVFVVAALSLCWPFLQGKFIIGGDQVAAGYSFRLYAAEYFKAHHEFPQWNPYLYGGLPFSAVIGHGDIFYPTAWLRWFVPVGFAMSFGFFFHIALAGLSMYSLVRGLKLSWTAAVVAGVAYQLSGNVASMLSNGHDGKLFVSALAPFAFLALFRAVREGKRGGYGVLAIVIGLSILSPAVQVAYYLMFACGMLALWLVFLDPQRRPGLNPAATLGAALGAVFLGLGISMIQILPILSHVKYTPRAEGGASTGWEHAISYSYHIKEIPTLVLPQFNGNFLTYTGANSIKTHTEYLGVIVVILAILGFRAAKQRNLLLPFAAIAGFFALVSFGGDTPFYSLWWHMPMMKQVRAAGMAFYLVGLCTAVFAACGVDRLLSREVKARSLYILFGGLGALALLGSAGALRTFASTFAAPEKVSIAMSDPAFALALQEGSQRLLLFVLIGGAILVTIHRGLLRGAMASAALIVAVGTDGWSVLRKFTNPLPPVSELFAEDEAIKAMKANATMPFRAFDAAYGKSLLMAHDIPVNLGYHGFQSFYFDGLFGGQPQYDNATHPTLLDLYAVNFIVVQGEPPASIPGFHKVAGPVPINPEGIARQAVLFQRDTLAPWVRVIPQAVKVPQDQVIPTLLSPAFPYQSFLLVADTSAVEGTVTVEKDSAGGPRLPAPSPIQATLADWKPGAMTVRLEGSAAETSWLVVAENWYPDWRATVDGQPARTARGDQALLSVAIPPGAKEISLVFDVAEYHQGKWITLFCTLIAFGIIASARFGKRRTADG